RVIPGRTGRLAGRSRGWALRFDVALFAEQGCRIELVSRPQWRRRIDRQLRERRVKLGGGVSQALRRIDVFFRVGQALLRELEVERDVVSARELEHHA